MNGSGVKQGRAKIVLGARSAVFAPVEDLGIIIIDEEHENSYQSDTYPNYTALEIAEKRCALTVRNPCFRERNAIHRNILRRKARTL